MPEFKARDAVRETEKRRELAPYIEAALARKPKMAPLDDAEIPRIEAFGRKAPSPLLNSDRGGAIPIPTQDPLAAREAAGCRFSLHCFESWESPERSAEAMGICRWGLVTPAPEAHNHRSVVSIFFTPPRILGAGHIPTIIRFRLSKLALILVLRVRQKSLKCIR